ncbi:flavohemoprotein [Streptomyces lunaelactis]|uniref:globin domain-containing protein n=3 Tax=Streptomyces lunaelactis TaxID=1535768 RepID=UPI0015849016|nr:globin domain-containing protein [Streptomyces lunaelactis]NUK11620.1 flavohemoprotein [Streptomyces lunaelactis]
MSDDKGDIDAVTGSLERVRLRASHVVRYFYAHLFTRHPRLRPLFPAAMDDQYERLFAALVHVIDHLDHPGLPAHLDQLGRDHRKFRITDEDYAAVGESLVAAIRYHSPSTWDEGTEESWLRVYGFITAAMTAGAHSSLAANEPAWWDATVVSHRLHGGHTAVIRATPSVDYPCLPGQYATIEHPDLPGVWRPYSVAGRPGRDGALEFHIGRVTDGLLSTVLCDRTLPGQVLRVGAASGSALTPPPGTPTVTLIAAGTGWAPVKAVLDELLARRPAPRIRIDVVARGESHFYDGGSLVDLLRAHPYLSAYWWYQERGEGRMRSAERLHDHLSGRRDWHDETVYLCGPVMFVQETAELLHNSGLPTASLIRDPLPASVQQRGYVSHAEQFLDPPAVKWIDPDARTRPLELPAPEPRPTAMPAPAPAPPSRGGWFGPQGAVGKVS